jgi:translocation and assembly module TamB
VKRRWIIRAGGALFALLVLAVIALLVVRSDWFSAKIRGALVERLQTAIGARVEIGAFRFDWHTMRVETGDLTLHGTEPADKPPLLHCDSVAVGLRIVSLLDRDVDIRYLDIMQPRVYLTIGPDGRTNIPQPKVKASGSAMETVLKLAVDRFNITRGQVEIESRGTTPFEAHGRELAAQLAYDSANPRYKGSFSVQPLELAWPGWDPFATAVSANVSLERNRIGIDKLDLATGASRVSLSGAIEDLASPHGSFRYDAHLTNADAVRILRLKLLDRGTAVSQGTATWAGGSDFKLAGSLDARGLDYHDAYVRLQGFSANGRLEATPAGIDVRGMRLSGRAMPGRGNLPVQGNIAEASLRGRDIDLRGVALTLLGGGFRGQARLLDLKRYSVEGVITGFDARNVISLYSAETLPWNALASGAVKVEGEFNRAREVRAQAALDIGPAPDSPAVQGRIEATYDGPSATLDLGRSNLSLPSSSLTASGAIGRRMHVHAETHDLRDLLPVLGSSSAVAPLTLTGTATFEGAVNGRLDAPDVTGKLTAGRFSYEGKQFDALQADVTASPQNLHLAHARLTRNGWSAGFDVAVALENWKAADTSAIFGNGSLPGAPASDLIALAGQTLPLTGTLSGTAQLTGTVANPLVDGDLALRQGSYQGEPFDTFRAHARYTIRSIQVSGGELAAADKLVRVSGDYSHQPGQFEKGVLRFQVETNPMPLRQIHLVQERQPGTQGTLQISAQGTMSIPLRVDSLHALVSGRALQFSGRPLGDLQLTAQSQNQVLTAHLQSNFAAAAVTGDGKWRLDGDNPGSADISFSKLDLAQLRPWVLPADSAAGSDLAGYAAGSVHLEGPALKPEAIRAVLRVPDIEVVHTAADLRLRNSGPLVIAFANSTATIESARFTGQNTDLVITGRASFAGKRPVDARVAGRIDLGIVHDWNRDLAAEGFLEADATIRGSLDAPQVGGRVRFQRAAFNISGVPNGISNATGAVVFSGDRASIESFSGETGGGKIQLSGFAAYSGGNPVFRVHADLAQVRVRYPEGVSTVADANLNFTGSIERSMLAGTITVLRSSFNAQSDFGSLIAHSAEPVRAPAVQTGLLGGVNFDINIQTSPDVQVESSLTQDVQLEANLHLRGTVNAPALLGRINITGGQLSFFGTRYRIGQGAISFFNPLAVEPILDVDLETKSRGIDVTLTVTGPLNKLALSYRSDPPLQFSEIVALLATGRTPTTDAALMSSANPAAQPFQQMGASALLGQAISSPVTGRLQRFFGVSQLRIDPTLPGVEYNPQARLTLQQQVTQNLTFTYITDVTSTNPQVVSVEWAFAKQWSAVAQRQENGMVGMDIIFKKRF